MGTIGRMERALGRPVLLREVPLVGDAALTVGRWQHGDTDAAFEAEGDVVTVIYNLSNTQKVERLRQGARTGGPFEVGTVTVVRPDEETSFLVSGDADILQIFVPVKLLVRADGNDDASPIAPLFQEHDREIERCAIQALVAARGGKPQDDLRLSEVPSARAMRLVDDHRPPTMGRIGGLAPHRLRRVQELIAALLTGPQARSPTLEELAREADLSVFHFARAFRQTVGETPHAYVLRRRLDLSQTMLAMTSRPIGEVARLAGFTSQAQFSERFRKVVGVRPSQFRSALKGDD